MKDHVTIPETTLKQPGMLVRWDKPRSEIIIKFPVSHLLIH